jgi:hypothetical protein
VFSVTFRIVDADMWQHLLVGKAIWQMHEVPRQHLWSWPTWGTPEVLPSWGFRALLWPAWLLGGVPAMVAWRWVTTLAVFAIAWGTARRMGAGGFPTLLVIVLCGLTYRYRSQVRPETLATILFVLELWVLEARRRGGPDRSVWLVAIAIAWANLHISYFMGLALQGFFALDARARGRADARAWLVLAISAVASLANPFGAAALAQPFEYFLVWRHEPIFRTIGELHGVQWSQAWRYGFPLLVVLWPLMLVVRALRHGWDFAETLLCAFVTAITLMNQRFMGTWAAAAAIYLSRDLEQVLARFVRRPWSVPVQAAATAAACLLLPIPEWTRRDVQPGMDVDPLSMPSAACDFMAAHGVRGHGFNHFNFGGYLLWRFWPDRDRLPFMDIHQSGTPTERLAYVFALANDEGWREVRDKYHFDWVLVRRIFARGDSLQDALDADTSFALVFVDDVASLYVKRAGPMAPLARSHEYVLLSGGKRKLIQYEASIAIDSTWRNQYERELRRSIAESPVNADAHSLLTTVALSAGRYAEAREHLVAAHRVDPFVPLYHSRMAEILARQGRMVEALREARAAERAGEPPDIVYHEGEILERIGDKAGARKAYRKALRNDPQNAEIQQALNRVGGP